MKKLLLASTLFIICTLNNAQSFSQSEYLTKERESLWNISILCYGSGEYWAAIWNANYKLMPDPNVVPTGVYLKIPELTDAQIKEGKGTNKFKESMVNLKIITDCQYFPIEKSLECKNNTNYVWIFDEYKNKITSDRIPEYEKLEDPYSKQLLLDVQNIVDGTVTDKSGIDRSASIWYVNNNEIEYIAISNESYAISGYTLFSSGFILMQFLDGYKKVFSIYSQESLEKIEKKEKVVEEKTVYQSFEVEIAPECVNLSQVRSSMTYPEIARKEGMEGRVTIKVLVGTDGNVIKVGSLSGPEVFHNVVRDKASNLQFNSGLQNGKPVKVWVTVPFNFNLK